MEKILDTNFASAKVELSHADFIGNDILLYDDIRKAPIPEGPRRMTFIFIALCTEGSARYTIDTEAKEVKKNDVVIISERHVVENLSGSAGLNGLCMVMSMDFYHETVRNVSDISSMLIFSKANPVVSLTEHEAEVFKGYFRLLKAKTAETEHPFRRNVVQALIQAMFYDFSGTILRTEKLQGRQTRAAARCMTRGRRAAWARRGSTSPVIQCGASPATWPPAGRGCPASPARLKSGF